jgi:hypothetical protein
VDPDPEILKYESGSGSAPRSSPIIKDSNEINERGQYLEYVLRPIGQHVFFQWSQKMSSYDPDPEKLASWIRIGKNIYRS